MDSAPMATNPWPSPSHHRSVRFDDWRARIETVSDTDQLVRVMRAYLESWEPQQLNQLPDGLGATARMSLDDIVARAVVASRVELAFRGAQRQHALLREMALTYAAAATRVRQLVMLRAQP